MSRYKYTEDNPLKVFTAFSGYDSQCLALDRIGIPYELVGWSEIDDNAIRAHNALYPQYADRNFGDIQKINWKQVPDFDLFTPKECFRLMDVSEEGIDKIQTAIFPDKKSVIPIGYGVPDTELKQTRISDSQQYKMAGNSIVVACLSGIFENLFTQDEVIKETLF